MLAALAESGAWFLTGSLLLAGLAGVVLPFLPGHFLILVAAAVHWWMLGAAAGVGWWTLVVLGLLFALAQVVEYLSGAVGSRWFGGSRWGMFGALVGGVVGLFFLPFGLILGPLAGAFLAEWGFARKEIRPATVSGVGSVVGTLSGLAVNLVIGVVMVAYFLIDVWWI